MSVSARSLLIPGMALATAGTMALTPAMTVAPIGTHALPAVAVPSVNIAEIQLAGIGRDIYDEITVFVQYLVSSAQFWIDLIPIIGPPLADQLGIVYFDGIQPVVADTVYYISDLIADPINFIGLTVNYASNLFYDGYSFVSAEAQYFGFPGLPPIPTPPPLASVSAAGRGLAPAAVVETPVADAPVVAAVDVDTPDVDTPAADAPVADAPSGAAAVRTEARGRAGRPADAAPRAAAPARAAASTAAAEKSPAAADTATADAAPGPRSAAKAVRGAARTSD